MSHGLVNNVSRSYSSSSLNACNAFIPASVSIPVIRDKAVLHILDGVKGLYHGGPSRGLNSFGNTVPSTSPQIRWPSIISVGR
jgi:hypothetical protein